jgi:purine-binding chemotaxis protein CheW
VRLAGLGTPYRLPAHNEHENRGERPMATAEKQNVENRGSMQLVSFRLGKEEYGVAITQVREIILMGDITRIPQTPAYIKGLINLRSMVIPVIDLRVRFEMEEGALTDESRIMVLNVANKTLGIIVDAVDEVLRVSHEQIAPPPPTVAGLDREYLAGLVKRDDKLLILLDINRLLGHEERAALESAVR